MDATEERVNRLFLSFVSDNWRKFLFPIAAIVVIVAFLFIPRGQSDNGMIVMSEQNPPFELLEENLENPTKEVNPIVHQPEIIIVDVKGAVRRPGVYTMEEGDRLIDAINAAGGYVPDADSKMVNHAMKLTDEFLIYIPLEGEELPKMHDVVQQSSSSTQSDERFVNINIADESELMTIPGIGPAKATAIISYREEHGLFSAPESLMDVSGIGKKTFEKIAQFITIN